MREGLPLKRLTLEKKTWENFQVETIIELCKNKVRGFTLNMPYKTLNLNDFTRLLKECPHVVLKNLNVESPDEFNLEAYMSSLRTQ